MVWVLSGMVATWIRSQMMHIEILTEDKSGALVVRRLTERLLEAQGCDADISVRPHRGCGNLPEDLSSRPPRFAGALLDLLPAKCRAYNKAYRGTDNVLVVIMDSDNHDPVLLRRTLYNVCERYAPDIKSVIGLCTEEIEAWLMGDFGAIRRAFPDCDEQAHERYKQDSVCGTWEQLCRVVCPDNYEDVIEIGYPAIGQYKARWADAISRYMDPDRNMSPSFDNYRKSLLTAINSGKVIHHRRSF